MRVLRLGPCYIRFASSPWNANKGSSSFVHSNQHLETCDSSTTCQSDTRFTTKNDAMQMRTFVPCTSMHDKCFHSSTHRLQGILPHLCASYCTKISQYAKSCQSIAHCGPNLAASTSPREPQHLPYLSTHYSKRYTGRSQITNDYYSLEHASVHILTHNPHYFTTFYDTNLAPSVQQHLSNPSTYTCHAVSAQSQSYIVHMYTNTHSPSTTHAPVTRRACLDHI